MAENKDIDFLNQHITSIIDDNFVELISIYENWLKEEAAKPKEVEDKREVDTTGSAPHVAKDKDDKEEIWVDWKEPEEKPAEEKKPTFDKEAMIEEIKAEIESGKLDKEAKEEAEKNKSEKAAAKTGQIDSSSGTDLLSMNAEKNDKIVCLEDEPKIEEVVEEEVLVVIALFPRVISAAL